MARLTYTPETTPAYDVMTQTNGIVRHSYVCGGCLPDLLAFRHPQGTEPAPSPRQLPASITDEDGNEYEPTHSLAHPAALTPGCVLTLHTKAQVRSMRQHVRRIIPTDASQCGRCDRVLA